MKTFFFPKLALDGIRKNRRMVFPFILTCICMISMFYILAFLASPNTINLLKMGQETTMIIMVLGCVVIGVFSLIFMYYTNSFLIRRRAAEFGLYNVLGMNKKSLAKIITHECLITGTVSLLFGLFVGIALSKLAELGLVKMIGGEVTYKLRVEPLCALVTVFAYVAIFALIWLSSVIRVGRRTTVSLLKSEKEGEKAPKANWLLGVLGAIILGIAYYMAVTIENPLAAIYRFFIAVVLVIIATYLLMIAGSVLLCRILQKNKNYYYNPKHFVSVSSMVYRMKRNGAGLASIAIIATMVLVMISSASCFWFGTEDMLKNSFPGDINLVVTFYENELFNEEIIDKVEKTIEEFRIENDSETKTVVNLPFGEATGLADGNKVDISWGFTDTMKFDNVRNVCFIPLSVYNKQTGKDVALNDGEAIAFMGDDSDRYETLDIISGDLTKSYKLLEPEDEDLYTDYYLGGMAQQISLVIPDFSATTKAFDETDEDGYRIAYKLKYSFDLTKSPMEKYDYAVELKKKVSEMLDETTGSYRGYSVYFQEREYESAEYFSFSGSLFFIGIILSIVFLFAAVLIIYYKQISEGYEDCKRFEVMRKVGMTRKEIKASINSQLLVVFFIPLIFAGVHLAFAFPMIGMLLALFGLTNKGLFIITTLISYAAFAAFYSMVYKVTSNVYYNIVSDAK